MKKLFFTAIAFIAFSGASIANTIDEKTNQNSISEKELNVTTSEGGKDGASLLICDGIWGSTRIYALNQGFTPDQASCMAMAALLSCMGFNDASEVKKTIGSLC